MRGFNLILSWVFQIHQNHQKLDLIRSYLFLPPIPTSHLLIAAATEIRNFVLMLIPVHLLVLSTPSRMSQSFIALFLYFFPLSSYPSIYLCLCLCVSVSLAFCPSLSLSLTLSFVSLWASEADMRKIADRPGYSRFSVRAWQTFSIFASVCMPMLTLTRCCCCCWEQVVQACSVKKKETSPSFVVLPQETHCTTPKVW